MSTRSVLRTTIFGLAMLSVAGCEGVFGGDGISDGGIDKSPLEDGRANIWVDPDGCQHWVIDDGIEGYMSPRLARDGTPVCQDSRGTVTLKDGSVVPTESEPMRPAG